MKDSMRRCRLLFFLMFVLTSLCDAQNAGFYIPDTVCADQPVIIDSVQPISAISYEWSFCTGNAANEPDGVNMGNPGGIMSTPKFITLVNDSTEFYTFATSSGNANVGMHFYGTSLTQPPLKSTNLGSFSTLTDKVGGIQVKKDNGIWYGFVANENKLVRLVFGDSLSRIPVHQVIVLSNVIEASGLVITWDGTQWVGFVNDIVGNRLFRLDFGLHLADQPAVADLGNTGQLTSPAGIALAKENDDWYAFICNSGNNTISRITFGATLQNPPNGVVLTNINGLNHNAGIALISDCGGTNGFVTNFVLNSNESLVHLVFKDGLGGSVTGYLNGNNATLNQPYGISEFVRQGGTLYAFVANYGSTSVTRMFFPSCTGASLPFYIGPDPPPITYHDPGTYNVLLTVVENSSNQSTKCKNIVVNPKPDISLGADRTMCQGTSLSAGTGYANYSWSTGATTNSITVDTSGTYSVTVTNALKCIASDTIKVMVNNNTSVAVDTTICQGNTYWAGQAPQTTSGIYRDTLQMANGCDSVVTTNLQVEDCPLLIWFPNAFTPNGDGVNDEFKPYGSEIARYTLQIFDRWGALIFESNDLKTGWNGYVTGREAGPDVYTFVAVFETIQFPGVTHRERGTFTLAR